VVAVRTRRVYVLLIAIAVLAGVLAVIFRPEREPEYGGRKLSEWVDDPTSPKSDKAADDAIRHIGRNALPFLLSWIRYEPSAWKQKLYWAANEKVTGLNPSWQLALVDNKKQARAQHAMMGLLALGPQQGALRDLTKLLNDPKAPVAAMRATAVLASYGSLGRPALMAVLTNHQATARQKATVVRDLIYMGNMGTNSRALTPILQDLLIGSDLPIREFATNMLREIDAQAPGNDPRPRE